MKRRELFHIFLLIFLLASFVSQIASIHDSYYDSYLFTGRFALIGLNYLVVLYIVRLASA